MKFLKLCLFFKIVKFSKNCDGCTACTVKGYLWVQRGYLSVLGGYLVGWVNQVGVGGVGRTDGWVGQVG